MDQSFKKIVIIITAIIIIAGALAAIYPHLNFLNQNSVEKQLIIHQNPNDSSPFLIETKGIVFKTSVRDTDAEREQGLSGTISLADDEGMLFVFDAEGYYQMWMKDMLFPLDIIWLDKNFTVVDIKKNVDPNTYPESFAPISPAKYVIEINSGISDKDGFKIGDHWKVTDTNNL